MHCPREWSCQITGLNWKKFRWTRTKGLRWTASCMVGSFLSFKRFLPYCFQVCWFRDPTGMRAFKSVTKDLSRFWKRLRVRPKLDPLDKQSSNSLPANTESVFNFRISRWFKLGIQRKKSMFLWSASRWQINDNACAWNCQTISRFDY